MTSRPPLLLFLALLGALLLPACQGPAAKGSAAPAAPPGWQAFGAPLSDGTPLTVDALLASASELDGRPVLVQGVVDAVCQVKGCWMLLHAGDRELRVTFKDYGFFVPKDIAGRQVRVQGVFAIRQVPLDEARHYLEDAGRHAEAAALTGPQLGYALVADGVRVRTVD